MHNTIEHEAGGGKGKPQRHTGAQVSVFLISMIKLKPLWLEMLNRRNTEKVQVSLCLHAGNTGCASPMTRAGRLPWIKNRDRRHTKRGSRPRFCVTSPENYQLRHPRLPRLPDAHVSRSLPAAPAMRPEDTGAPPHPCP